MIQNKGYVYLYVRSKAMELQSFEGISQIS